jgi:hypothetical protein
LIDQIVRDGARRMLAEALQAEVEGYIAQFVAERDENGRRLVVRNGCHQPREVLTSAGVVEVTAPRVNDRRIDPDTGERRRFSSAILPPWCRKTPKINEVLPLLYLHGLSTGDFGPALGQSGVDCLGLVTGIRRWAAACRAGRGDASDGRGSVPKCRRQSSAAAVDFCCSPAWWRRPFFRAPASADERVPIHRWR